MFGCLVAHTSYRGEGLFSTPKSLSYYIFSAISQVIKSFRCFYNYQVKYGRPQTLGAQRFSWLPEHVLRELFLRAKPTHPRVICAVVASSLGPAMDCIGSPPLTRFGGSSIRQITDRLVRGCPPYDGGRETPLAMAGRGGGRNLPRQRMPCSHGSVCRGPAPRRPPAMPWPVRRWGHRPGAPPGGTAAQGGRRPPPLGGAPGPGAAPVGGRGGAAPTGPRGRAERRAGRRQAAQPGAAQPAGPGGYPGGGAGDGPSGPAEGRQPRPPPP